MWIRARFFGISKKHESRRFRAFGMCLGILVSLAAGCVVTDKITFEDAVNQPFSILDYAPSEHLIYSMSDAQVDFRVTVGDPDVTDPEAPEIRGLITVLADDWSGPFKGTCKAPIQADDADHEWSGYIFDIECSFTVPHYLGSIDGSLLTVNLSVSDLGFLPDDRPRKGAHLVDLTWVVSVERIEEALQ
jgi:hypothetical protein